MSDDKDDLDEFARMFGAEPETPPEGLIPPAPTPPRSPDAQPGTPEAASGGASDPLAWLVTPTPPPGPEAPTAPAPVEPTAPTTAFPSPPPSALPVDDPVTTVFPGASEAATTVFPGAADAAAAATLAAFPPAPAPVAADPVADAATTVFPTRRSVQADAALGGTAGGPGGDGPDTGRRNLIILGIAGGVLLILIIVLVFVLVGKFAGSPTVATPSNTLPSIPTTSQSPTPSITPSQSPSPTPTETSASPTPSPTSASPTAPPVPAATITKADVATQPACPAGTTDATFTISYTVTNTSLIRISKPDGTLVANVTPDPSGSGTTPALAYSCGTSTNFTVAAIGSGTPASKVVTPVPTS